MTDSIDTPVVALPEPVAAPKPRVYTAKERKQMWVAGQVIRHLNAKYHKVREHVYGENRSISLKRADRLGYTIVLHPKDEQAVNPDRQARRKLEQLFGPMTKRELQGFRRAMKAARKVQMKHAEQA